MLLPSRGFAWPVHANRIHEVVNRALRICCTQPVVRMLREDGPSWGSACCWSPAPPPPAPHRLPMAQPAAVAICCCATAAPSGFRCREWHRDHQRQPSTTSASSTIALGRDPGASAFTRKLGAASPYSTAETVSRPRPHPPGRLHNTEVRCWRQATCCECVTPSSLKPATCRVSIGWYSTQAVNGSDTGDQ